MVLLSFFSSPSRQRVHAHSPKAPQGLSSSLSQTDFFSLVEVDAAASDFARALPRWELERHFPYTSIEDKSLDEELDSIEERARIFMQKYKGRLHEKLLDAIVEYERIEEALGQGRCYAYLVESVSKTDPTVIKRKSLLSARTSK